MSERGLICCAELVRAILDNRKTQTRRLQGLKEINKEPERWSLANKPESYESHEFAFVDMADPIGTYPTYAKCPYGKVGDLLWVRETFVIENTRAYGSPKVLPKDRPVKLVSDCWEDGDYHLIPHYRATEPEPHIVPDNLEDGMDDRTRWSSSRFMPKWAARIWLEITNIRVERVQDISERDCIAEGCPANKCPEGENRREFLKGYMEYVWDSLNAKRGYPWEINPWVWVIEFKRIER